MLPIRQHGDKIEAQPDGCWIWTAAKFSTGYGAARVAGDKTMNAHRAVWLLCYGPLEGKEQLDHLCERRDCVNPAHLEPVDTRTNLMRSTRTWASINAAKTHCPKGHSLDNPVRNGAGHRGCRTCHNERRRLSRRVALT
jgi:hypothetical protein